MWEIRQEARGDALHIDELSERSFGPGRFVKTVYRLREGVNAEQHLGFVAIEEGVLRGSVRFWPICVGTEASLMLGPLAVQPDQRGRGIGIALMNRGIEEARARGHRAIIVDGAIGALEGSVHRARLDDPVCADGAPLGMAG